MSSASVHCRLKAVHFEFYFFSLCFLQPRLWLLTMAALSARLSAMISGLIILSCSDALFAPHLLTHTSTGLNASKTPSKGKREWHLRIPFFLFVFHQRAFRTWKGLFFCFREGWKKRQNIQMKRRCGARGSPLLWGRFCLVIADCNEAFTLHYTPWILRRLFKTLGVDVVHTHSLRGCAHPRFVSSCARLITFSQSVFLFFFFF